LYQIVLGFDIKDIGFARICTEFFILCCVKWFKMFVSKLSGFLGKKRLKSTLSNKHITY
jgi:hypothetical protein